MSRTWAGTPVHVRRRPFSDYWDVTADAVVVGTVRQVGDTWAWMLADASDAAVLGYPTKARAVHGLLQAYGKALDTWATP